MRRHEIIGKNRHRHRQNFRNNLSPLKVALAGNPNSGKTTIFNGITGQRQHISNYPGVTVEKKSGEIFFQGRTIEFIDLPGTYSLSAYSMEEIVSRDFVMKEKPDVIVDVLDSTNLDRHLYLLLQFQELGVPVVGVLNMSDEAKQKGININRKQLENLLGIPLVRTVGKNRNGIGKLLHTIVNVADGSVPSNKRHINYGRELEQAHNDIIKVLEQDNEFADLYSLHWMAIKLLEKDSEAIQKIQKSHKFAKDVLDITNNAISFIEKHFSEESDVVVSEQRYAYIHGALRETVKRENKKDYTDFTEKIDRFVLNRYLGIPIFTFVMFLMYQLTFRLGNPISNFLTTTFDSLSIFIENMMPAGPLQELLTEGIIGGVGGVIVFLPLVVFLFLGLSFLEDTGYMARSAFVMDKFFHLFGLHGRSFIPFMVSSGCAVPGILSARVLANPKDRIVTILVSPLMMCGAKTPVIAMLTAAFFPKNAAFVFWCVWLSSWLIAFVLALIFRTTLFRGEQTPFVMELPPYRIPTLRGIFQHVWEKSWEYIKKAGTVILAASVIIWFLLSYPKTTVDNHFSNNPEVASREIVNSYGGKIGKSLEPILKLAGFDWKIGISLFAGTAAKEIIISTMGIVYGISDENNTGETVMNSLKSDKNYSPLIALSLMIFIIIYVPCIATLAMVKKELGSWKWPLFQAGYTLLTAYGISVIIYQVGMFLGFGG